MNRLQPRIPTASALGVCQAGQQKLFRHDNERVAKELNELADTIEAGQKAKEEFH